MSLGASVILDLRNKQLKLQFVKPVMLMYTDVLPAFCSEQICIAEELKQKSKGKRQW